MKKLFAALLTISITAALTGCNKPAEEQTLGEALSETTSKSVSETIITTSAEMTETEGTVSETLSEMTSKSVSETIITTSAEMTGMEETFSKSEILFDTEAELEMNETERTKKDYPEGYAADRISILGTWYGIGNLKEVITFGIDGSFTSYSEEIQVTENGFYTVDNGLIMCTLKRAESQLPAYTTYNAAVIDGNKLMMLGINSSTEFEPYESGQKINDYFKNVKSTSIKVPEVYSKEKLVPAEQKDILGKWICFNWSYYGDIDVRNVTFFDFEENSITTTNRHETVTLKTIIKDGHYTENIIVDNNAIELTYRRDYGMYKMDSSSLYIACPEDDNRLRILKKCSDIILTKEMLEGAVGAEDNEYHKTFFQDGKYHSIIHSSNLQEYSIFDYFIEDDTITFIPESETERLYPNLTCKYYVFDEYVYAWNNDTYFIIKLKG